MYLENARKAYQEMLVALDWSDEAAPCTISDIEDFENALNMSLPLAYREFLLWMGDHCGKFMYGEDYRLKQYIDNTEVALELMEMNKFSEKLPKNSVIFSMHEGWTFSFFCIDDGDNPPIHRYSEQEGGGGRITWDEYSSLENYLLDHISGTIELLRPRDT